MRSKLDKLRGIQKFAFSSDNDRVTKNPPPQTGKSSFVFAQDYNPAYKKAIEKQNMVKSDKPFSFAIVGSGPAGFYMAKNLIRHV